MAGHDEVNVQKSVSVGMENNGGEWIWLHRWLDIVSITWRSSSILYFLLICADFLWVFFLRILLFCFSGVNFKGSSGSNNDHDNNENEKDLKAVAQEMLLALPGEVKRRWNCYFLLLELIDATQPEGSANRAY